MSSLSDKSAQEISDLLDEYGIKHGPVVESTRNLYEKKLKEAMAKGKRAKPSPDKTYYREEGCSCYFTLSPPHRSEADMVFDDVNQLQCIKESVIRQATM
uniref:LEM domain-containing protein n=1 Tax=Neolamprologus brichardi TaxID=32507 RepID=A0A3Q4MHI6_NEOBR